jgi:hypothetical protein
VSATTASFFSDKMGSQNFLARFGLEPQSFNLNPSDSLDYWHELLVPSSHLIFICSFILKFEHIVEL